MTEISNIPDELKEKNNWVGFRLIRKEDGAIGKLPINCKTGKAAKSNDSSTWCSYDTAVTAMKKYRYDCLGFAFDGGGIIGIDLDHCIDNGKPNAFVKEVLEKVHSYAEYSPAERDCILSRKANYQKVQERIQNWRFTILTVSLR